MINHKNFKILAISKDEMGKSMKLEIELPDGTITIRWALDNFTYRRIKEITSRNYFDSLSTAYRFELVSYYISCYDSSYRGYIRCIQADRAKRIEFICSENFAGNMEWFRKEIQSIADIQHLAWENNSPAK